MKAQIDIHRTNISREVDDESRFSSFRHELEDGSRYAQFVVALVVLSAVILALLYFF